MDNKHTLECPHCAREVHVRLLVQVYASASEAAGTLVSGDAPPDALDPPSGPDAIVGKRKHQHNDSRPVYQACTNCHSRKKKCSTSLPCEACARSGKTLECAYLPADARYKRKKSAHSSRASQRPSGSEALGLPDIYPQTLRPQPPPPSTTSTTHDPLIAHTTMDLGGPSTQVLLSMGGSPVAPSTVPQPAELFFSLPLPSLHRTCATAIGRVPIASAS